MALLLYSKMFYKDMLHFIEKGNVKLVKSITLSITSRYNHINLSSTNSNTLYSDITRQKVQSKISFLLNEHGFPPLSNVCQPILSNVSESRLYQRKPASNVKLVSVHVSPVYASSVSKLIKPLNNSKRVCSSNATQRNVCNASSVSQLIKPLNVSKPVCSSKATKRNVCNANSVSQFTKPLNVSKPLCSSKATKRNVCNASSISKLIKPLNSVNLFVPIMQLDSMSVRSVVLLNSSNHQLLVKLSSPIMSVMSVTSAVIANSSKHLMLLNLSVPVMQVILSFVIPLVSLFLILLVITSQLNLLVNLKV